jgi:hypothetical protein
MVDVHSLALGIAERMQAIDKGSDDFAFVMCRYDVQGGDARPRPLRARGKRPGDRCTTEQRDELAALHLHPQKLRTGPCGRILSYPGRALCELDHVQQGRL